MTGLRSLCRGSVLLALAHTIAPVYADNVSTTALSAVPSWALGSAMYINFGDEGNSNTYTVLPLTTEQGLNQSTSTRERISIAGPLSIVNASNFQGYSASPSEIIYISCSDETTSTTASPDIILNSIMDQKPLAILLYSTTAQYCSLSFTGDLEYNRIFTTASASTSATIYNSITDTNDSLQAQISGSNSQENQTRDTGERRSGGSAIAMSLLYGITGIISLLFLIIVSTGAVRAHRYPERYGPRESQGTQPGQSRARGLARAVLGTLPIIKFGDPVPTKADRMNDVESGLNVEVPPPVATRDSPSAAAAVPLAPLSSVASGSPDAKEQESQAQGEKPAAPDDAQSKKSSQVVDTNDDDDHLGCSICTDDFQVGEDVRVLPCDHKFHPACVDPWLLNVSGTCPLCRLDLNTNSHPSPDNASDTNTVLPPPLDHSHDDDPMPGQQRSETEHPEPEHTNGQTNSTHHSNSHRTSKFIDFHRLRAARTRDERIQILRQLRNRNSAAPHSTSHGQQSHATAHANGSADAVSSAGTSAGASSDAAGDDQQRDHQTLAERFRERFKIRTRTHE
ncbi:hypothetical protein BROUX41_005171 [Berkeleyomyces rouxiae]|uniref:uncharacterized protein n=1 Tax=Berkeleyomyces rouxiae TaxID=2035830 RepID=UPI003B7E6E08